MAHLVLFETGGNQRFIFATNKLAENLGASQMLWELGIRLVIEEVGEKTGKVIYNPSSPHKTRANLLDASCNPELRFQGNPVEVVVASSGKAILLVDAKDVGLDLVYAVTRRCIVNLPGVALTGYVGRSFDLDQSDLDFHEEIRAVHQGHAALSGTIPGPEFRFLRLPIVAACATSNLPASDVDIKNNLDYDPQRPERSFRSEVSMKKWKLRGEGRTRMQKVLQLPDGLTLMENLRDLEDREWLAVIHADGNGLGAVFQNFGEVSGAQTSREYIDKLRMFSLALDRCTETAASVALTEYYRRLVSLPGHEAQHSDKELPAVPLVLGGDDLTMVCDGRIALRTTEDFLTTFAKQLAEDEDIQAVAKNLEHPLTASAGVAIIKPHFPFHLAYDLAEALLRSAKRLKPKAGIDFLVHYDASGSDLRQIRAKLNLGDAQLYARPYQIGEPWDKFREAIETLNGERKVDPTKPDDEDEPIPRSLLHELRSALFLGPGAGDQQLRWALERRGAGDARLREVLTKLHGDETLFREDGVSALLDVLEAQEFSR